MSDSPPPPPEKDNEPGKERWPKLAIIVTWTAIGPYAGAIIGFMAGTMCISPQANFLFGGSYHWARVGSFYGLFSGLLIGILIGGAGRKR